MALHNSLDNAQPAQAHSNAAASISTAVITLTRRGSEWMGWHPGITPNLRVNERLLAGAAALAP